MLAASCSWLRMRGPEAAPGRGPQDEELSRSEADERMTRQAASSRRGIWGQIVALYELLSSTRFAILVVIALAIASILGLVIIDQIPFRGEMARMRYAERLDEPLVWFLVHIVPASPFRSLLFRVLLALLSLSLLACTIKRGRRHWREAWVIDPPDAQRFRSPNAVVWQSAAADPEAPLTRLLRGRQFALRRAACGEATCLSAKRFGLSRLGPVLTHVGFLALVVGGLWMASSGSSRMLWLRPGETATLPEASLRLTLEEFQIETTPRGQIADYFSHVALFEDTSLVRRATIEVNKPLRHRGYSLYQTSYRQDPTRVRSADLLLDLAQLLSGPEGDDAAAPGDRPTHGRVETRFDEPLNVRIPWGRRVSLGPAPYAAEIDTFFADFRILAGGPGLASEEPRNPALRLRFFAGDSLVGANWYFAFHPEMSVGSGPDLPLRFISYDPLMTTGLELSTHPGSGWVWAGIVIMTLGTLLSFLLRYERAWLRLRRVRDGWEITLLHQGSPKQAPEYARREWERYVTPLAIEMMRRVEPRGGRPVRWPGMAEPGAGSGAQGTAPRPSGKEAERA
ncbi:MAG: hypothetical protein GF330_03470 [Candidatus Eisenbacteria bacterium]|nr:hypothetical protein [Candidatus Eisenbacteria bacterium]